MLKVEYGGMVFTSRPGVTGFAIRKGGFTGWWDRPAAVTEDVQRPGQYGLFSLPVGMSARMPQLTLFVEDKDPRAVRHKIARLSGLPSRGRMVVTEFGDVEWADAELLEVGVARPQLSGEHDVSLMWRCPDPRKYGELREFTSTGATVDLWHRGTADAIPEFKVTGFTGGYRIAGRGALAGNFFTVNGPKAAGTVDTVSFRSGMLLRNGEPVKRRILQNHVWTVPPGAGAQFRIEPIVAGQSGSCTALVTDTFV